MYLLAQLQRCADVDVEICAELLERGEEAELIVVGVGCVEMKDDVGDSGFVSCFGGCHGCFVLAFHHLARESGGSGVVWRDLGDQLLLVCMIRRKQNRTSNAKVKVGNQLSRAEKRIRRVTQNSIPQGMTP